MKYPATTPRVLLIADPSAPAGGPRTTPIRRYRLARLRIDGRSSDPAARFEHLKRTYD